MVRLRALSFHLGQRVRENGPHPHPFSRREKGASRARLRAISFTLAGVRAKQRKNGPHPPPSRGQALSFSRGEKGLGVSLCAHYLAVCSVKKSFNQRLLKPERR